jgi:hypothetical protein
MTTTTSSAALVPVAPVFTNTERLALAGSWPATTASPARRTNWTCASMRAGATSITCACSRFGARTSSASPLVRFRDGSEKDRGAGYDLYRNNCEHFAIWYVAGRHK